MSKHRLTPFQPNERLKQERLLRGWSQVYIANAVDTDGYTVNRWERGRARPGPYFRQKLCVLFEKNAVDLGLIPPSLDEANRVASSSPNDLPPAFPWSVPYPHNSCFTGCKDILHALLSDHPHSIATTFLLALKHVEQEQAIAADMLRICTLLHAEAIPEELFREGAAHLGLGSVGEDSSQFDQAIAALRHCSLLQHHPENHTLSIHCLVQAILRESLDESERACWLRRLTATLNAMFPAVATNHWDQCERLLPHILTVAAWSTGGTEDQHLVEVLQKVADYLQDRYDQHDKKD